jgi:hypothetical protein
MGASNGLLQSQIAADDIAAKAALHPVQQANFSATQVGNHEKNNGLSITNYSLGSNPTQAAPPHTGINLDVGGQPMQPPTLSSRDSHAAPVPSKETAPPPSPMGENPAGEAARRIIEGRLEELANRDKPANQHGGVPSPAETAPPGCRATKGVGAQFEFKLRTDGSSSFRMCP